MSQLDRAHSQLNDVVKRHLKINPGLESVERRREYKGMIVDFKSAMLEQMDSLLDSNLFVDIGRALHDVGKAQERIHSESDELEIYDAVVANMQSLEKQKDGKFKDMFADFLILVFNLGGQDFLNKHNIPYTFELKNEAVITHIKSNTTKSIKGIDETTQKWVVKQISSGRKSGLSNDQIADTIREKVPETYANRAQRIVQTETSNMVGESEQTAAVKNGASHKEWVTVGDMRVCPICENNEGVGMIGIEQPFPSGDMREPAHPSCRCLVEYVFTPFQGTIWAGQ